MALPMNVSGIRRNIKNIAHNYTDAQVKVREATSNDPWGPSSTIMSEIADLTYNVVAFSEIMQMVWKRLNDHGKNWRHVYKALVLLEYLIKTGSEKVAEQSRENIHSISTLKDFQYIEEGKDQGINVREKAKAMVALLKDDERLRSERVRALKAKERFAQSVSGIGGDHDVNSPTSPSYHDTFVTSSSRTEREAYGVRERATDYSELESARPHTLGEEELQLQLALAMSKEEADNEEARRRSDDVRLQMALNESKDDSLDGDTPLAKVPKKKEQEKSGINDLLDINFNPSPDSSSLGAVGGALGGLGSPLSPPGAAAADPWMFTPPAAPSTNGQVDPWGVPVDKQEPHQLPTSTSQPEQMDPWGGSGPSAAAPSPLVTSVSPPPPSVQPNDPWSPPAAAAPAPVASSAPVNDPWNPCKPEPAPAAVHDPWAPVKTTPPPPPQATVDPFAPISSQPKLVPEDDFSMLTNRDKPASNGSSFNMTALEGGLPPLQPTSSFAGAAVEPQRASPAKSRSPAAFLGENSNLVNLDNLVASKTNTTPHGMGINPFSSSGGVPSAGPGNSTVFGSGVTGIVPNPFQAAQAPKPSINELRSGTNNPWAGGAAPNNTALDHADPFML